MTLQPDTALAPPAPRNLEQVGLPPVMMRDILLKTIFRMNLSTVSDMAREVCLPIPVTQELVDLVRDMKLLEAMGTLRAGAGPEMAYQLSDTGRARAQEALAQSGYYGAMPVPLSSYQEQVERQSIRRLAMTRERLQGAMGHLILPPGLLQQLGPAVSAGRSILLYGPPGNGKSSLAAGIRDALGDKIYVPRALEYSGQVIAFYDPTVHNAAEAIAEDPNALRRAGRGGDARYVYCDRPTVMTGGELSLSMLDMTYNATAKSYQAPLQLKSTGGVFIVDDLGRQKESPQSLINRWIVPLEEGRDILTLQSGEKFEVPFDTLVIFSTNFHPTTIFDQAALRRIFYKIKVDGPSKEDFLRIFAMTARRKQVPLDEEALIHLMTVRFPEIDNRYANYQAGFLLDQIKAACEFEGAPPHMTPALIDRAWANLFVDEGEDTL